MNEELREQSSRLLIKLRELNKNQQLLVFERVYGIVDGLIIAKKLSEQQKEEKV